MRRQDEIKPRPFVFDLPGIDRSSISDAVHFSFSLSSLLICKGLKIYPQPSSPNRWQKIGLKLKRATDEAVPIEENAQDIVDKLFAKVFVHIFLSLSLFFVMSLIIL